MPEQLSSAECPQHGLASAVSHLPAAASMSAQVDVIHAVPYADNHLSQNNTVFFKPDMVIEVLISETKFLVAAGNNILLQSSTAHRCRALFDQWSIR